MLRKSSKPEEYLEWIVNLMNYFSDSKILDKDLLTNDNKRCEFAKMYKHTTTSDKDEKCGNYTVKADVYNEKEMLFQMK